MSKYIIMDSTSNTGKYYIDENGDNCIEENAEVFDNFVSAEQRTAQIDPCESWSVIMEKEDE